MALAIDLKEAFLHLFFPQVCPGCHSDLVSQEQLICRECMQSLPFTGFEAIRDNPVEKLFWGRSHVQHASSMLYFIPDTPLQHIIHHIKYRDQKDLGIFMGKMMGDRLRILLKENNTDICVPMPLHPSKEKKTRLQPGFPAM